MSTAGSREINVTPLIDLLLVLLIILLVMMPIMLRQETVELPRRDPSAISEAVPISIKIDADFSIKIDDGPVFVNAELAERLRPLLHKDQAVFVDFADAVPWNEVVATVDTVRGSGAASTAMAFTSRFACATSSRDRSAPSSVPYRRPRTFLALHPRPIIEETYERHA